MTENDVKIPGRPVRDNQDQALFKAGIHHFNREEFFEAHDVWEELWKKTTGPDRPFLQGLIQVASAMHHMKTGNMRGARLLHDSGTALLSPFGNQHGGLDLARLREDFDRALTGILEPAFDRLAGRGQAGEIKIPWTSSMAFRLGIL